MGVIMMLKNISPCINTAKLRETKDFYVKHFKAKITFDSGWYINLQFGDGSSDLQFMAPQQPQQTIYNGQGLHYNFLVDNVDEEYTRLVNEGLEPIMPLEDHPWGDRGFAVADPNGIILYIFSEIAPSEEFKQYYK